MTIISGRSNRSYDPPRFMEYFLSKRLAPVVTTVLGQTLLLTRVDFVGKNLFHRFHPRLIFNR